jgi:hypothetical protein
MALEAANQAAVPSFQGLSTSSEMEQARSWSTSPHYGQADSTPVRFPFDTTTFSPTAGVYKPLAVVSGHPQPWLQSPSAYTATSNTSTASYESYTPLSSSQYQTPPTQQIPYSTPGLRTYSGAPPPIELPRLYTPTDEDRSHSQAAPGSHNTNRFGVTPQTAPAMMRPVASPSIVKASTQRRTQDAPFRCILPGCDATFTRETNLTRASDRPRDA